MSQQKTYIVNKSQTLSKTRIQNMFQKAAIKIILWKQVTHNLKRFVIYGLTNLVLLILGSLMFFYIEHCYHATSKSMNTGEKSFIEICDVHLPVILSENKTGEVANKIKELCIENQATVIDERKCAVNILEFFKWMEYSFSVAFTLGYGRMVVRSDVGKILTIVYAIPTITLSTITYIYCGQMVKNAVKLFIIFVEFRFLKRGEVRRLTLKTLFLQLILCITIILLFSWFFTIGDSMMLNYLDAFYFVMVTLLTIGFGDIVVDLHTLVEHPYIFIAGNIIFIFGLGILASLITSLADLRNKEAPVSEFIKKTTKKIKPKLSLENIIRSESNSPS